MRLPLRSPLVLLLAGAFVATTRDARADGGVTIHGTGAASVGYNDNALAVPRNPPPGTAGPLGVFFLDLRPGALLFLESPAVSHRVRYVFATSLFLGHPEANSYSNTLDWNAFYVLGARSSLVLSASLTEGRTNTFSTLRGASGTAIAASPSGGTTFFAPSASEGLAVEVAPRWRLTQDLVGGLYKPLEADLPVGGNVDTHLGVEHLALYDAIGVEGRAGYASLGSQSSGAGVVIPRREQLIFGAVAKWRHDLSRTFTSELDAGVVEAQRARGGGAIVGPAGLAAIRYSSEDGSAEASYTRGIQPNLLLGQSFYSDQVTLRGAIPLAREQHFFAAASVGYQHGRAIDVDTGTLTSTVDVYLADAALSYVPNDAFSTSVRYQRFQQTGNASDAIPLASFARDIVLFTVAGMWPPREQREIPYQLPLRVDAADNPMGAENRTPDDDKRGGSGEGSEGGED